MKNTANYLESLVVLVAGAMLAMNVTGCKTFKETFNPSEVREPAPVFQPPYLFLYDKSPGNYRWPVTPGNDPTSFSK